MPIFIPTSVATTHYTDALLENQVEIEAFPGLRPNEEGEIVAIIVESKENLSWQIEMYDKNGVIISKHAFLTTDAQVYEKSGVTWYNYTFNPLEEWKIPNVAPYETINIGLRNKSSASKTASTDGQAIVKFMLCK